MKSLLMQFAEYHEWAFDVVLSAIRDVDDATCRAPAGLFFGSIHGTLNHLLVAEHVWFGRFVDEPFAVTGLDAELEADRDALDTALRVASARWRPWIAGRNEAALAGRLDYRNLSGARFRDPVAATLLHVFNHATHHRGQISAALTTLGADAPVMDLIYFLRERSA